jgi:hypothetical protein
MPTGRPGRIAANRLPNRIWLRHSKCSI